MEGKGLVEKVIDYTYTLPNGAQVVIQGVPALCDERGAALWDERGAALWNEELWDEEDGFFAFSAEVAERLYDLIKMAEARNPAPDEVVTLPFDGLEGPHTSIGIE